jgi:hypothetical protein
MRNYTSQVTAGLKGENGLMTGSNGYIDSELVYY